METGLNESKAVPVQGVKKRGFLSQLGPAFITSALMIGPGSLTLSSKIGAIYGVQLIWALVIIVFFMMIFTEMSTRIGLAANESFIQVMKKKWGRTASIFIGIGAFLVTASFQAGNALGSGLAVSLVTGTSANLWIVIVTVLGIAFLFSKNFYQILEKLMLGLVLLMLFSFAVTVILAKPSLTDMLAGFVPVVPDGSLPLIIALTATSFSIVGACYQSYLVQEKGWKVEHLSSGVRESYLGIFILGLISLMLMLSAAAILKPQGIAVNSVSEMGLALEPAFGNWATVLFMLGLFGASFSSLMGNATIGGAMLSDGLGFGSRLTSKMVKGLIILVMAFGSIVGIIFGSAPVNMIIFAQAITIVIVPFIAVAILVIANDEKIMGALKNTLWKNIVAIAGLAVLILLAVNNIMTIFFN
ncbi:Nramp family divalent metal transporter [Bacillus infantis]|uniref:Nramp family divalent metal transporter n=1 Tax=Bacillus infantis TaxID=324767 RepID=UPI000B9B943E|nr:Nramp family divalent metal transporter [Bacillus infantis]MCK6207128.1 Nramp family divalent metal transporter [Bacillus infantis]OXT14919.1 manganese transporter [Bacillus sp. OG2]